MKSGHPDPDVKASGYSSKHAKASSDFTFPVTACFSLLGLLASGFIPRANAAPIIAAGPMSSPITLDGKLTEPAWRECVHVEDMLVAGGTGSTDDRTTFRIGYRDKVLYIGVTCVAKSKPKAKLRERDTEVYCDDSIELFLASRAGGTEYYQLVANAVGSQYDGKGMDKAWNGDWQVKCSPTEAGWQMEFAIPFAALGGSLASGQELGFNLCRNDVSAGGQWQTWAQMPAGGYHQPSCFGRLVLRDNSIGISGLTLNRTPDGSAVMNASCANPGKVAAKVSLALNLKSATGSFTPRGEVDLAAAETKNLRLSAPGVLKQAGEVSMSVIVSTDNDILYASPSRSLLAEAVPILSESGVVVALENSKVRFEFDPNSGALISLERKDTGMQLRPRREPLPIFSLDAVPFRTHPIYFKEDDIQRLQPDSTTCRECRVERQTLHQRHAFPSGVEVEVTVRLPADSAVAQWQIRVNNKVSSHPSQAVVVHRVAFPHLRGLRADEDPKQSLAVPQNCGLLVPSPVANLPKMPSYRLTTERGTDQDFKNGRYSPAWPSMTWMDLSGSRGGLYLASHDIEPVYDTTLEVANDQQNSEMEMTIRRWSPIFPGESWNPGPCSVGVHEGDWHWSADRYREWFYSTFKPRPLPKWLRECSGWNESGGGALSYTWNDLPDAIRRGKPYGLNYLQKWCNMTGGELGYAAFPFPNPYAGSFPEFKRAVKRIHEMGGHLGFYHNLTTGDPMLGKFFRQPRYRQKIPADIPIPDANPFANGWLDQCKIDSDNSYHAGGGEACYLDGYWWNCWGAKVWMDYCYDWLVNRWRKEYGLDACYLDSTGPYACPCFNLKHGHDKPRGQMQFLLDFYKRLAQGSDPDYAICQEFVWDRLMLHGTHSLTCFHLGPFSEPALFRYTHPDYPLFCGCVNFFGGRENLMNGAIGNPTWPEFLGYVFLYGGRFDHYGAPEPDTPYEWRGKEQQEEVDLLLLRHALRDDLNNRCDFRDQIGLSGLPDKVHVRVFIRRDKTAALVTVLDLREKKGPLNLTIDLKQHGLKNASGAEVIVGGGQTQALSASVMKDGMAVVNVPEFNGKVAAIRISTTR